MTSTGAEASRETTIAFSRFLRFKVLGPDGSLFTLLDLGIPAICSARRPEVIALSVRRKLGSAEVITQDRIGKIDWGAATITIGPDGQDPAAARAKEPGKTDRFWLKRDILDAMILDLPRRRATRASDLWLCGSGHRLEVCGVDLSLQGLLRRFPLFLNDPHAKGRITDWSEIEYIPEQQPESNHQLLRVSSLPPGEIAQLLAAIPYPDAVTLLGMLPGEQAADALEILPRGKQVQLFEELGDPLARRLLGLMAPNDCADVLGHLPAEEALEKLEHLPAAHRDHIVELLRYPPGSIGGIMTNDVVCAPIGITIGEARQRLQVKLKRPDFIHFIYVVEDDHSKKLRGVLPIRRLLTEPDNAPIEGAMTGDVITLHPLDQAVIGAWRVLETNLAALPVVGNEMKLLGVVTVDAAIAETAPLAWSAQSPKIFS